MNWIISHFVILFFGLITLIALIAALISFIEHETRAAIRLFAFSIVLIALTFFVGELSYQWQGFLAMLILASILVIAYLFLKKPIISDADPRSVPKRSVDEHDVIFARMRLKPNTSDWDSYYSNHPYQAQQDSIARSLPGLLARGSKYHNPLTFASADANFSVIDYLHSAISHPISNTKVDIEADKLSLYIKSWAKYLGVHSIGIAELKDNHLYTVRGRGVDKGKPVEKRHRFAIAFTVEMSFRNVQSAPDSSIILESSQQYLNSANVALQIANFLKGLGYDSRAHIDGDYELICPLVARDAGLGEIGRMGLLITPKLGPRVRIAVVTTNAPLQVEEYKYNPTVIEFCTFCKKCADCCPGRSIPMGDMEMIDGVKRWKIDSDSCYQYWCTAGTDCGRCISVCPFSHPNNILHNSIRHLIYRSRFIARAAYLADDFLYGRKPTPKPIAGWMKS